MEWGKKKKVRLCLTVGFVSRKRPFSTEAPIGLSYTVEKELFRLNFFRLSFPTGGSKNSVAKVFALVV